MIQNVITSTKVFAKTGFTQTVNDRKVRSYLFESQLEGEDSKYDPVDLAHDAISSAIAYKGRVLTFRLDDLENELQTKPYLIRSGNALSLSSEPPVDDRSPPKKYIDGYFSHCFLQEPVKCDRGHTFERSRLAVWIASSSLCPSGKHELASRDIQGYTVDEALQRQVIGYLQTHPSPNQINERLISSRVAVADAEEKLIRSRAAFDASREELVSITQRATILASLTTENRMIKLGAGGLKIVLKIGTKELCIVLYKQLNIISKTTGKQIVKAIPFVGLGLGLVMAAYRCWRAATTGNNWEYVKAVAEVGSGVASLFPGIGTGIAIGIDAALMVSDLFMNDKSLQLKDLEAAYALLKLDRQKDPSRSEVDKAYHAQMLEVHPDKLVKFGEQIGLHAKALSQGVNDARDKIYKDKGWDAPVSSRSQVFEHSGETVTDMYMSGTGYA